MHSVRIGIEYIQTSQLREWRRNPRVISDEQYRALAENVRKYGIVDPLIVDQQYRIVGGHQRLKVLKDLGLKTVPVVKLQLSRQDFKILNLALNKITGEWDRDKLVPLLEEFAPLQELDLTGFTRQEANLLIEEFRVDEDDAKDATPALPEKPAAKRGDLYKLGNHSLLCGDATNPKSWNRLMDGQKGHLAVTDPPYGVDYAVRGWEGLSSRPVPPQEVHSQEEQGHGW